MITNVKSTGLVLFMQSEKIRSIIEKILEPDCLS
jgi:hypothetical protein